MRYVVLGAGAVGGVIGARLHRAGHPTTLVARGAHLAAIREQRGLVVDRADGRHLEDVPAVGAAHEVAWTSDTVVLLCVKSHQTETALLDLVRAAPASTAVVCAQNGVTNERLVLRHVEHTYGLTVMLPSLHLEPGVVVEKCHPVPGLLDLGRFPGGVDATAEAVAADLRTAGFASVPRPDIMAWKHRKLLVNAVGDVGALLGRGPAANELVELVRAEGEAVLVAGGIPVVTAAQDAARRGDLLRVREDAPAGNSLRQSLARQLPSEIDHRAGEIVLLGRLHDVATPANEAVRGVVRRIEGGGEAPSAEEVLAGLRT